MTVRAPHDAEILLQRRFDLTELRALRSQRRGRVRLFLEVHSSMAELVDPDEDDGQRYRCSEFATEPELRAAFERAAGALAA